MIRIEVAARCLNGEPTATTVTSKTASVEVGLLALDQVRRRLPESLYPRVP